MEERSIGCGPINSVNQIFEDPQVIDRGMKIEMPHPAVGGATAPMVASPLRFSETPVSYRHAPPMLGADTEAVLNEVLGIDAAHFRELSDRGVV